MEPRKRAQVNLFAKQHRDTDVGTNMDTKQGNGGWDELGDWD